MRRNPPDGAAGRREDPLRSSYRVRSRRSRVVEHPWGETQDSASPSNAWNVRLAPWGCSYHRTLGAATGRTRTIMASRAAPRACPALLLFHTHYHGHINRLTLTAVYWKDLATSDIGDYVNFRAFRALMPAIPSRVRHCRVLESCVQQQLAAPSVSAVIEKRVSNATGLSRLWPDFSAICDTCSVALVMRSSIMRGIDQLLHRPDTARG